MPGFKKGEDSDDEKPKKRLSGDLGGNKKKAINESPDMSVPKKSQ
jgi:hypothetical protein